MPERCLTKCQGHLGKSWSGQKLHMEVSLDVQEGGVVSWSNAATVSASFARLQFWTGNK